MIDLAAPSVTERTSLYAMDVLRSEFVKMHTVRFTYWALAAAVIFNAGIGALAGLLIPAALDAQGEPPADPVRLALAGIHLSQIAFGVLGALVVTSEYSSGTIRATFAAVPQRKLVMAAKVVAFATISLTAATGASFAGFFAFQLSLTDANAGTSLGAPDVLRAVLGGGLYLATLGLLGLGLGILIRSSAGTIATLLGILFVPSILIGLLPQTWQASIGPYLPMEAGSAIYISNAHGASLGPWTGFAVFAAYALATLAAGFALIGRRDA